MQYQYTFKDILNINHGDIQAANEIVSTYLGNGLIKKSNDQFEGYLSQTLTSKDLRLKSKWEKLFENLKIMDLVKYPLVWIVRKIFYQ